MAKYEKYAEYQDSGIEWLGKIPEHWAMSKLRYLFDFSKGLSITKENLQDEGIPCVNYGEVHSKYGFEVDPKKHTLKCVSENYLKTSENAILNNGDFVFADTSEDLKGSGNFTHLVGDEQIFAGYHTVIARPHNSLASRFYAYLFESKEFRSQIQLAVKGVKVFSITQAMLRSADAWLPSPDEQVKIANFLDHETAKIDSLIAKQQKLIELLKEKRQAVISHAVTKGLNPDVAMKDSGVEWLGQVPEHWLTPRLKQLIKYGSSISYGIVQPGDPLDEGVPFIQTTNISKGSFALEDFQKTSVSIESNYPRSRLEGGEVILGIRASIGAAFVVPMSFKGVNLSRGIARIVPNNLLRADFLVWYFKSNAVYQYWGLSKQGSTFSEVSIETVKELNVVIPPLVEQADIAKFLTNESNKFEKLINSAETQKILLQERRTALISSAVTGKIDVHNWQYPNEAIRALSP
ncbi:MAG: type I restriction endonuclease subunit S [Pseudomonadales bacterium RIFCSPHIGHO2_12_FULL_40_16]|nr:MAG: type I restriction endonuclease subunit S [Pseudomonadales bacterium RIFCSPHIGHO2_12_FULL_40_16]HLB41729.1 restriction endonuclease subunit S [Gammaproteobacteria bacterium]